MAELAGDEFAGWYPLYERTRNANSMPMFIRKDVLKMITDTRTPRADRLMLLKWLRTKETVQAGSDLWWAFIRNMDRALRISVSSHILQWWD